MTSAEPPVFTGLFPINGATRLYGTIGDPIRQLRMTGIMPQVFAAVGANAVWLPFDGAADLLPVMLEALARMRNLGGFTVTIPHKTGILPLLGRTTRRAEASGSVNLVRRDPDGVLAGDNVPVAEVATPPKGIHIAINATPLGLRPGDPLSFDPVTLDAATLVAEVIMSPVETPLLGRARTHGRRIHHGRHMLDHQIPLYLEWFGIDAKGIDVVALVRSLGT